MHHTGEWTGWTPSSDRDRISDREHSEEAREGHVEIDVLSLLVEVLSNSGCCKCVSPVAVVVQDYGVLESRVAGDASQG